MAVTYNPRIVTDGLVLCLDAGNTRSYSSTLHPTWTDLSPQGNNGTLNGMTFATDYSSANGGSLSFDGTAKFVRRADTPSLNFGTGNFSVSAWFRRTANATSNLRLLSKGASDDTASAAEAGFSIFGNNGGVSFAVNPTGTRTIVTAANYSLGEWLNVMCVVERGVGVRAYKNTILTGSATAPSGSVTGTSNLIISGHNDGAGLYWSGSISNVCIYNIALTDSQIKQNFNALRGRYGI